MPKSIVQTIHAVEFIEETAWLGVVRETRRSRWVRSGNAGRIKVEKEDRLWKFWDTCEQILSSLYICLLASH